MISKIPIIFPLPIFSLRKKYAINTVQIYVILPRGTTTEKGIRCNSHIVRNAVTTYKNPPKYKCLFLMMLKIVPPFVDFFMKRLANEAIKVIKKINT